MPALNTAVAGLSALQQKVNALADNIANVNTVGFKSSKINFSDSFYQTLRASSSTQPLGIQVGSGGQVTTIGTDQSQGSIQRTGGTTDLAISGEGFFVVRNSSGQTLFTRSGDFSLDRSGNLISSLGMNIRGVIGNPNSQTGDATDPGTGAPTSLSNVIIPTTFVSQAAAVASAGTITVGTDLPDVGETLVVGGVILTYIAAGGSPTSSQIELGTDAATTAAKIVTALAANSTISGLVTGTSSGNVVTLKAATAGTYGNDIALSTGSAIGTFTFSGLPTNNETFTVNGTTFTFKTTSSASTEITIGSTAAATATNMAAVLNTTANKALTTVNAIANGSVVYLQAQTGGTAGNSITTTESATNFTVSGATLSGGVAVSSTAEIAFPSTGLMSGGSAIGSLSTETVSSFVIGLDGKVSLFGSGGTTRIIAYIPVAKFANAAALQKAGNNLYQFSEAAGSYSGSISFSETSDTRKAGTNGFGQIQSGALEVSNVDLSQQFSELIVTQRAFQANSRVITTADELLQDVVNLKR